MRRRFVSIVYFIRLYIGEDILSNRGLEKPSKGKFLYISYAKVSGGRGVIEGRDNPLE